tara:strand:+ start:276 stop:473 length:198 start_codon:yes stop_codon:yes gene_type:complete
VVEVVQVKILLVNQLVQDLVDQVVVEVVQVKILLVNQLVQDLVDQVVVEVVEQHVDQDRQIDLLV